MAYFYNSNYYQNPDNYHYYYDQYNYYNHYDSNQEPRYDSNYQYSNTQFYGNAYQQSPSASLVGYYYSTYNQPEFQENGEYYYDPVSTQFVVAYNSNTAEEADVVVEEKEDVPKTFHGGYDITKHFGKPLPPSEEICHPPSKIDPKTPSLGDLNLGSVPSAYVKEDKKEEKGRVSEVIHEENGSDLEDDDEEYDEEYDEEEELEEEEKQGEIDKEGSKLGPIIPLVGALPAKESLNLEGEAKPKEGGISGEVIQENKALDLEEKGKDKLDEPKTKSESVGEVIKEEKALELVENDEDEEDYEDEDEDEDEDEGSEGEGGGVVSGGGGELGGDEGKKVEDYGNQVRRQIPPGYGIEAFDICEGLFGGYFPCLWKRNQRIYNHQRDVNEKMSDYDYCWKETADYLFGNPNPYGGTMPEKGSYGDPVYSYQRHYPQQPVTEQLQYLGGNSSYLQNSRNFYGQNGGYY